ncbi:MAG: TetR/AcrR family transcriptional regulator [Rhodoferax sp.]
MPSQTTPATTRRAAALPGNPRLTRDDWLDAALRAAIDGGFGAVRVLVLAKTLGVTRGSFYWHFADHAELIQALIERWYQREISLDARLGPVQDGQPRAGIERVLDSAIARTAQDRDNGRFEQALRSLASKDAAVAQLLEQVDRARLGMIHAHYLALTGDDAMAHELSALLYLAVVGANEALNRPSANAKLADYLKATITRHLIDAPARAG